MELQLEAHAPNTSTQGLLVAWREELDGYYQLMRSFDGMECDEVMERLSGIATRVAEIRTQCVRLPNKAANHFRTQEIDKMLDACEFAYKCHSRAFTVKTFEYKLMGTQT